MSSFGAIPLDLSNVDFLVSSANKCLEGVPGFGYALCRKERLNQCKGKPALNAISLPLYSIDDLQFSHSMKFLQNHCLGIGNSRTLSLDLYDQVDNLDKTSQFRFTPPTHTILAFKQALNEFWKEGGVEGRAARYNFM